jgi:nicotinate-nucleotide--dimethylbenzimidazole phosphoribosyltransferase
MNLTLTSSLASVVEHIKPCDVRYTAQAKQRLDSLTKPIGSLGRLEPIAAQMYAIFSGRITLPLHHAAYVFAADHGVTEEGVSAYPREVTTQMVLNFLNGGAAINVLARLHEAELTVVDVGVDGEFEEAPGLYQAKVRRSSRNMAREPAMTDKELSAALEVGFCLAREAAKKGQQLIAVGEMGIGNTTAASAIAALLTKLPVGEVTGLGTGLDEPGKKRKIHVIEQAIARHFGETPKVANPVEVLRCVGGLEIAAMTGFILEAAANHIAVICDGFISTAAAAVAYAIAPQVSEYLFGGHCSEEPGHHYLLNYIGLTPILHLDMRLGEGTGAVLSMPIIESSLRLFTEMATFASAGISTASE